MAFIDSDLFALGTEPGTMWMGSSLPITVTPAVYAFISLNRCIHVYLYLLAHTYNRENIKLWWINDRFALNLFRKLMKIISRNCIWLLTPFQHIFPTIINLDFYLFAIIRPFLHVEYQEIQDSVFKIAVFFLFFRPTSTIKYRKALINLS